MSESTDYVVGFLFDRAGERVLLIEKQRPDWQRGRLNGIGGHIESGETPAEAMRREFQEEAGVDVPEWKHYATLQGEPTHGRFCVHFFHAFSDAILDAKAQTDERLQPVPADGLNCWPVLPNLHWLIPMAQHIERDAADSIVMTEIY